MQQFFFFFFAIIALSAAISVIAQKKTVYSALSLIVCLCALAALFVQLHAEFVAIVQVIVYAGAIMVLFLFVIMLLDPLAEVTKENKIRYLSFMALPLGTALFTLLVRASYVGNGPTEGSNGVPLQSGTTEIVGKQLFKNFLLPFEVTSILILAAILGAVVLAKKRI